MVKKQTKKQKQNSKQFKERVDHYLKERYALSTVYSSSSTIILPQFII